MTDRDCENCKNYTRVSCGCTLWECKFEPETNYSKEEYEKLRSGIKKYIEFHSVAELLELIADILGYFER